MVLVVVAVALVEAQVVLVSLDLMANNFLVVVSVLLMELANSFHFLEVATMVVAAEVVTLVVVMDMLILFANGPMVEQVVLVDMLVPQDNLDCQEDMVALLTLALCPGLLMLVLAKEVWVGMVVALECQGLQVVRALS